jgi:hypothetical protein
MKPYKGFKYDLGKGNPHIPNKFEGKLLRRLMSENNMTEDEVRSIKKYRKLLSDESKEGEKLKGEFPKWCRGNKETLWKRVTKTTGLVRNHPVSKYVYNKLINDSRTRYSSIYFSTLALSKKDLEILEKYDLTKL